MKKVFKKNALTSYESVDDNSGDALRLNAQRPNRQPIADAKTKRAMMTTGATRSLAWSARIRSSYLSVDRGRAPQTPPYHSTSSRESYPTPWSLGRGTLTISLRLKLLMW